MSLPPPTRRMFDKRPLIPHGDPCSRRLCLEGFQSHFLIYLLTKSLFDTCHDWASGKTLTPRNEMMKKWRSSKKVVDIISWQIIFFVTKTFVLTVAMSWQELKLSLNTSMAILVFDLTNKSFIYKYCITMGFRLTWCTPSFCLHG